MAFKTLNDVDLTQKRVLVRCDFNVPLDKKGEILDDYRIVKSLDTIKYLIGRQAKIILMSHLDPESTGVVDPKFKLDDIAKKLSDYLDYPIKKTDDCIGPDIESQSNHMNPGDILLLENLRFYKEETSGDIEFAKKLSYLGDIYVNDAFSVCHRDHASITGVPQFLQNCVGLLLQKEIESLDKVIKKPESPMIAIIGGKKVDTKSKFINKISEVADTVIISGLLKKEVIEKNIVFNHPEKILSPADSLDSPDIDQKTIDIFTNKISGAKTVLWNGPFGRFEEEKYSKGTFAIASAIINSGAFSVVGGGETVEFIEKKGIIEKFSHVSTGGGAMLSYLSGDKMPGLEILS